MYVWVHFPHSVSVRVSCDDAGLSAARLMVSDHPTPLVASCIEPLEARSTKRSPPHEPRFPPLLRPRSWLCFITRVCIVLSSRCCYYNLLI